MMVPVGMAAAAALALALLVAALLAVVREGFEAASSSLLVGDLQLRRRSDGEVVVVADACRYLKAGTRVEVVRADRGGAAFQLKCSADGQTFTNQEFAHRCGVRLVPSDKAAEALAGVGSQHAVALHRVDGRTTLLRITVSSAPPQAMTAGEAAPCKYVAAETSPACTYDASTDRPEDAQTCSVRLEAGDASSSCPPVECTYGSWTPDATCETHGTKLARRVRFVPQPLSAGPCETLVKPAATAPAEVHADCRFNDAPRFKVTDPVPCGDGAIEHGSRCRRKLEPTTSGGGDDLWCDFGTWQAKHAVCEIESDCDDVKSEACKDKTCLLDAVYEFKPSSDSLDDACSRYRPYFTQKTEHEAWTDCADIGSRPQLRNLVRNPEQCSFGKN